MKNSVRLGLVGLMLCVGLSGCASKWGKKSGHDAYVKSSSRFDTATTQGIGDESSFESTNMATESREDLMAKRTYYFGFDRYNLSQNDMAAIQAHADYLLNHPNQSIRIEGYTDERGSREYNIALGEKRAKSVDEILMARGVQPNQIRVVSYGAEKPAMRGQTEEAYAQNRRAIIVYEG